MAETGRSVGDAIYKLCEVIEKGGEGVDAALREAVGVLPKLVDEPLVKQAIEAKVARRKAKGAAARFMALGWFIGAGAAVLVAVAAGTLSMYSWGWQTIYENGNTACHPVPILALIGAVIAVFVIIGTLISGVTDYGAAIPDLYAPEGPVVNEMITELRHLVARR